MPHPLKRWTLLSAIAWVALVAGCSDDTGKLAASGTGDVSNPPAARGSSASPLDEACGPGAVTAGGAAVLRRWPYLQDVTTSSASVALTSVPGVTPHLTVTLPDGSVVAQLEMGIDASAHPPAAEQHLVTVDGLTPGTLYCYAVDGLVGRAGFRTAPALGGDDTIRFVAFGDSGSGGPEQRTLYDQMRQFPFDFVIHLGDLAYEKGAFGEIEQHFFRVYSPTLRSFPVFPAIGNHDVATASGAPYLQSFVLPSGIPEREERQYSFDFGDVHFVALDTERIDAEQSLWLDEDLGATSAPWSIVFAHRPAYSSGAHGGSAAFRQTFGPILKKHAVPLVLSGHEHDYERTLPIAGTTYVVSGGGGRETRAVGHSVFTAYSEDVLHFLVVEANARRIALHAIDGVGREFDSAVIERQ